MRSIYKRMASGFAVAAAGACVLALATSGPASASGTDYTISPAGNTSVTATSGTTPATGTLVFQDTTHTGAKMTCAPTASGGTATFKASGTAFGGGHTFVPATPVAPYTGYDSAADLTSGTLGQPASTAPCKNALVGTVTVTLNNLPWHLGCVSKTTSGSTVTGCTGYLYGVSASLVATGCSLTGSGAIFGTYTNATGTFTGTTTPGLTVSGVSGSLCAAIPVANGDQAYLSGSVTISPTITVS